jgi:hypothetical protein
VTICIAALAEKGQACIVAADREITVSMPLNIAFEHHERKIEAISKSCAVMSSGNALIAEEVITRTRRAITGAGDEDMHRAATILRDTYMQVHIERAEQLILRPRGLTLQEFRDFGAQKIPLPIYQQIDNLFWNFMLQTEFIIAGVDTTGGHIGWVHYHGVQGAGWLESFDKLAYHAIGTGGSHAGILLSLTGQHRELSTAETVWNIYMAKVNAEVAPGVGEFTDMAIVTKDGIEFLSEAFITQMEKVSDEQDVKKPEAGTLEKLFNSRKGA